MWKTPEGIQILKGAAAELFEKAWPIWFSTLKTITLLFQRIQARLLKDYLVRFGELPPLNSTIPGRYEEATWCEIEKA